MITGNDRRVARPGPGDIVIPDWQAIPLATSSVLRTRRVWTAETRDILRVLGAVPDDLLDRARELVRESIGNSGA